MDYQKLLLNLEPHHEFFIGIDSDGCVFDTMEVKQKKFFIPNALEYFNLYPIENILRETWEFVNLYSIYRGGNRFNSLIKVFELLHNREEIRDYVNLLPNMRSLKQWVGAETKLGNANLRIYFGSNYDADLEKVVKWTEAVNKDISESLRNIHPFHQAKLSLEKISSFADLVIVSQTPLDALEREWEEHDLKKYITAIAGQEHGTKMEHIAFAAGNKYLKDKVLMIGDAKGDLDAAEHNGILFYPILPGKENQSWEQFLNEGFDKFLKGMYAGRYEDELKKAFEEALPVNPPWSC